VFNQADPNAKGAMVANSTLAAVSVWSGLHEHLLFESYTLATNMQTYADQLKLKQAQEYELADKEGRLPGQYWLEIEPPKVC
jgi:endoribonuclease Dicer